MEDLIELKLFLDDSTAGQNWMRTVTKVFYEHIYCYTTIQKFIRVVNNEDAFHAIEPLQINVSGRIVQIPNQEIHKEITNYATQLSIISEIRLDKLNEVHQMANRMMQFMRNMNEPLSNEDDQEISQNILNERDLINTIDDNFNTDSEMFYKKLLALEPYLKYLKRVVVALQDDEDLPIESERNEMLFNEINLNFEQNVMPILREDFEAAENSLLNFDRSLNMAIYKQKRFFEFLLSLPQFEEF